MSDRYSEILRESGHRNYIPLGRQLPRTPPLTDVKRHLDFCSDDASEGCEEAQEDVGAETPDQDDSHQNRTFDFGALETKKENVCDSDGSSSMLKGMKGYQLTSSDLEFIERMKEEKLIKKLQGELEEVQRQLRKERLAFELTCASREKAQAELKKFPSCEELTQWVMAVLTMTPPSTELTDLDTAKALLAMVTKPRVQRAVDEKRTELRRLKKMVANKRKKEARERGQLQKQIAGAQLRIQAMMGQLSDLKSELAQQEEEYKALEMQIKTQEVPVEAKVDASEEPQATKSQAKHKRRERKKADKSTEKLQDTTNQSKSTRSKHADNQASVKDDPANNNTNESTKSKQRSGAAAERPTKSVQAARRPPKKAEEEPWNPPEPERAGRGRRKPAGVTQPKNPTKRKGGGAELQQEAPPRSRPKAAAAAAGDAAEEAQDGGPRRSKRIASRR